MELIERLTADVACLRGALRTLRMTTPIAKRPTHVFPQVVSELAEKYGDAPALLSDRERLSYRELAARSNRYARWALAQGLRKGDTVCLLMQGRPEFLALWIGLTRVGGVVALLNTNLTGTALAHCINVVSPRHIIVAADLLEALASARPHVTGDAKTWLHGDAAADIPRIDRIVDALPGDELAPSERRVLTIEDRGLYIYTSGTTGLPKAATMNHYRVMLASHAFAGVMDTRESDRMYDCLPLYHTAGGLVATGALLVRGGSVVIRERFSAHEFWDDIMRWDCTCFQYIGELCRYLLHAPAHRRERSHRIRLACGNGLRPDVWNGFKERFAIPRILEFYAATEGNVTLFNTEGKPGAIGRVPSFLAHRSPTALVRYDVEQGELLRDAHGRCIRCGPHEAGEAIGKIASDPGSRFEGYTDKHETEKKIVRDAFEAGDAWFRTGDLMRKDEGGHFYFVDRIGDTFRWKGENVSTSEVSEAIAAFPGITQAIVYGVAVPGCEGRAGMAAVVSDRPIDLVAFREHLAGHLPEYARPLFLRVCDDIDVTGTFKPQKNALMCEGYAPAKTTGDQIYFRDRNRGFIALDGALLALVQTGRVRL